MPEQNSPKSATVVGALVVAASPSAAAAVEVGEDIAIELAQASEPTAETEEAAAIGVTPDPNRATAARRHPAASSDSPRKSG